MALSIKFPDLQVLVSRTDQIPKILREGDPTGAAGRLAAEVAGEYQKRPRKVSEIRRRERLRNRKEQNSNNRRRASGRSDSKGSHFDIRA